MRNSLNPQLRLFNRWLNFVTFIFTSISFYSGQKFMTILCKGCFLNFVTLFFTSCCFFWLLFVKCLTLKNVSKSMTKHYIIRLIEPKYLLYVTFNPCLGGKTFFHFNASGAPCAFAVLFNDLIHET